MEHLAQISLPDLDLDNDIIPINKNGTFPHYIKQQLELFALYKWDGGNTLNFHDFTKLHKFKPNLFENYKKIKHIPNNIVYNYSMPANKCPHNNICITPQGKILYNVAIDPEIAFMDELELEKEKEKEKSNMNSMHSSKGNSTSSSSFRFLSKSKEYSTLNDFLKLEKGVEIAKETKNFARTADNYTSIYINKLDLKALDRKTKMRMKKAIIINKVFDLVPLVGEILALVNIERINLLMCKSFILKEINLLKKYLIMWDANNNFLYHSAKVLFILLTCNNDRNKLRFLLNELMEGLCKGDDRSIRIFKEIVITVLIDALLKTRFYYYDDIQAKFNLVRVFNKEGFHFRSIVKLKFVEAMKIPDDIKEKLTFIIMRLDSQTASNINNLTNNLINNLINF